MSNQVWTGKKGSISLAKSYIRCIPVPQFWVRFLGREKGSQWEQDQRPLPAAGSLRSRKKSIPLHLCNLLLFIKCFHIPYLQKKYASKCKKACPYSQRQTNTPEFQISGRVGGSEEIGHASKQDKILPFRVKRRAPEGVLLKPSLPPDAYGGSESHQALSLQAKSFIPVKCRFCRDDRPASVTSLLHSGVAGGAVWKGQCFQEMIPTGKRGAPGPPSQVSQLGSGQNLQIPPPPRQVWPKIQDALTSCLGQPPPSWRLLSAPTFSLFISG